jgi:hypothetical protein
MGRALCWFALWHNVLALEVPVHILGMDMTPMALQWPGYATDTHNGATDTHNGACDVFWANDSDKHPLGEYGTGGRKQVQQLRFPVMRRRVTSTEA